jgi:iron(III) transport system substrate-binding protein
VRSAFVAAALALLACKAGPPPPPAPEVALHATVGRAAAEVLAGAAAARGVARVRLVATPGEAEVLWLGEPTEVLDLGALVEAETAPAVADVAPRFRDPRARFAPLCARARVLLRAPGAPPPFEIRNLRDLADPRLAGRVAVPPLASGPTATALAALRLTYGEGSLRRFLDLLARNGPRRAAGEGEVLALVARGEAALGLAGSEEGAAAALGASGVEVVFPDQEGRGAVVLPTAVALAARAVGREPARALAAFLVGADAERLLTARVPGFMPLRPEVPVPAGVRPAAHLASIALDWDALAAERRGILPQLAAW